MNVSFNIPATVMTSVAAPVVDIPTPISIIAGFFGGGKHHPGRYAWRYIWGGIQIGPRGNVKVAKMYRQRLWRAGERRSEQPKPFGGYGYIIARRLGDIIRKLPLEKRLMLMPLFNKLNEKFKSITWSVRLKALRQQGPAIAAFDALKHVPAILLTYGNAVRQALGVKTMEEFIKSAEKFTKKQ